ncbi:hypothetical protein PIB30_076909 [Stylosanthes scabra]|uniref:Uncharacterized protein n=1 Tax=Stylosanthes scabra TaxID=79078 RepID=A0ABU6QQ02_9FABA|nr:hypothetical protein [Stylosanthes scabra]
MASSNSSSSRSSGESYPKRSSSSEERVVPPAIRAEAPIADEAPVLVASEGSFILLKDGLRAPDPCVDSAVIWQKQIFLPFTIDSRVFSFLGPILVPRKGNSTNSPTKRVHSHLSRVDGKVGSYLWGPMGNPRSHSGSPSCM